MSLAKKIIEKFNTQRYKLYYEPLDVVVMLSPLTVGQRQAAQKIKDQDKQQAYTFSIAAFDEDGAPAVDDVKEVQNLPELLVGLCVSVIFQLTNGASHNTCNQVVKHFIQSVNIIDDEHQAELDKLKEETEKLIQEETSLKNA
jgi:hypothetical protein